VDNLFHVRRERHVRAGHFPGTVHARWLAETCGTKTMAMGSLRFSVSRLPAAADSLRHGDGHTGRDATARIVMAPRIAAGREWRRRESNPLLPGASGVLCLRASSPGEVRTDGVEPPQREAPRLQRGELTHAQRPQE
jgi:hypothetical protein